MTDAAEAAVAVPEPSVAPATQEQPVQTPQPIESRGPQPESKPEPKEPAKAEDQGKKDEQPQRSKSVSEALKKADEKAREKAAEKKVDEGKAKEKAEAAKPDDKPKTEDRTRDETGKFAAKEQPQQQPASQEAKDSPHRAIPERFKSDQAASAEWEKAPESVRAAVHRVTREMEQGITKYKADAEEYGELKEYRELASKHGTSIKRALDNYVGIEQLLNKDPIAGLEKVVSNLGLKRQDGSAVTLRDVAGYILGQKPEDVASRQDAVIQSLNRQIEELKTQIGGVTKNIESQQTQTLASTITGFAQEKDASGNPIRPRFDELEADIAFFLTSDKIDESLPVRERLSEAYKLAERLNPAPQTAFQPPAQTRNAPDPNAEAQTLIDKGSKSVSGAPSGDQPGKRSPSSSIRESLRRAAQAAA